MKILTKLQECLSDIIDEIEPKLNEKGIQVLDNMGLDVLIVPSSLYSSSVNLTERR